MNLAGIGKYITINRNHKERSRELCKNRMSLYPTQSGRRRECGAFLEGVTLEMSVERETKNRARMHTRYKELVHWKNRNEDLVTTCQGSRKASIWGRSGGGWPGNAGAVLKIWAFCFVVGVVRTMECYFNKRTRMLSLFPEDCYSKQ